MEPVSARDQQSSCPHCSSLHCQLSALPCSSLQAVTLETELHEVVSMSLADSLRVLLEHGLLCEGEAVGGGGVGCGGVWSRWGKGVGDDKECAAWKVFLYYYGLKVRA